MRKICWLLPLLFSEGFCSCNFAKSTGFEYSLAGDYNVFFFFFIDTSKIGYHIILDSRANLGKKKNGTFFGFMPLSGERIDVSFAQSVLPDKLGPETYEILNWRKQSLKRMRLQLKSICQKNIEMDKELALRIKKFFERKSMSIVPSSGWFYSGLHIVRVDEKRNRTFLDMDDFRETGTCLELKNFIQEYFLLYDGVRSFFESNMEKCSIVCEEKDCKLDDVVGGAK